VRRFVRAFLAAAFVFGVLLVVGVGDRDVALGLAVAVVVLFLILR